MQTSFKDSSKGMLALSYQIEKYEKESTMQEEFLEIIENLLTDINGEFSETLYEEDLNLSRYGKLWKIFKQNRKRFDETSSSSELSLLNDELSETLKEQILEECELN